MQLPILGIIIFILSSGNLNHDFNLGEEIILESKEKILLINVYQAADCGYINESKINDVNYITQIINNALSPTINMYPNYNTQKWERVFQTGESQNLKKTKH